MIIFKFKEGLEGYETSKGLRDEYLNSGAIDEHDANAIHITGYENGIAICTGRMYTISATRCVIDNVIVDKSNRLQYVGDTILRALEDKAVQLMRAFIDVTPNHDSLPFFLAEGYTGDTKLTKDLTKPRSCHGCKGGHIK